MTPENKDGEMWTAGLDELAERCEKFQKMGIKFTKFRCVYKIDSGKYPSTEAIRENSWTLAKFAKICQ